MSYITVSKTVVPYGYRGFESHPHRHYSVPNSLFASLGEPENPRFRAAPGGKLLTTVLAFLPKVPLSPPILSEAVDYVRLVRVCS